MRRHGIRGIVTEDDTGINSLDIAGSGSSRELEGLRVVFFGLGGVLSRVPLEALLRAGADVRAVVTAAQPGLSLAARGDQAAPFERLDPPTSATVRRSLTLLGALAPVLSLRDLAAQAHAPLLSVTRLADTATLDALADFEADAIAVSCFSRRLPSAILAIPRLGCLNTHPSLLPDNRGPDPLFWTFHAGAAETGATIHLMDEQFDSGAILRQARVGIHPGETETALEGRLARLAGVELVAALAGLASGALAPVPQDEARATSHPWPSEDDYTIPASWSAQRAYSFACGVVQRGEPMTLIAHDGARFRLLEPLGYDALVTPATPWRLVGDQLTLACEPGAVMCRVDRASA